MKNPSWLRMGILFVVGLLHFACATTQDAEILNKGIYRQEIQFLGLQKEINSLKDELRAFQKRTETDTSILKKELDSSQKEFKTQLATLRKEVDLLKSDLIAEIQNTFAALKKEDQVLKNDFAAEARRSKADFSLRLDALYSEIRALSAAVEEYNQFIQRASKEFDLQRGHIGSQVKAFEERIAVLEERDQTRGEWTKAFEDRIKGVEDHYSGLESRIDTMALKQTEVETAAPAKEGSAEVNSSLTVTGKFYKDAYETFHRGDLEGALNKFEAFVKQYPHTPFSDNAHFWIGEIYYQKRDFEKAILEYEKVIVKYPEGDKVPAALFKQALAFLELGDNANARNLLRRVIDRYPQFEQVDVAKKKLESIR